MQGKICLITGATDGIGKETARVLAARGATVIVHGRNPVKSEKTVREIKAQTGNQNVGMLLADLSAMQQVRDLAAQFKANYNRLDVLINNAGAFFIQRKETVDGLEMTFALNHLNYFLLTNLLLDTLKASAPARIINVSSSAHYRGKLDFDDLQHENGYRGFDVYSDSKLMNVMFTYELARRWADSGVTTNALHPGLVATNFAANNWGILGKIGRRIGNLFSISVEEGARTIIMLATAPEVEGITGKFYQEEQAIKSSDVSYIEADQCRLWEISTALTGLAE